VPLFPSVQYVPGFYPFFPDCTRSFPSPIQTCRRWLRPGNSLSPILGGETSFLSVQEPRVEGSLLSFPVAMAMIKVWASRCCQLVPLFFFFVGDGRANAPPPVSCYDKLPSPGVSSGLPIAEKAEGFFPFPFFKDSRGQIKEMRPPCGLAGKRGKEGCHFSLTARPAGPISPLDRPCELLSFRKPDGFRRAPPPYCCRLGR